MFGEDEKAVVLKEEAVEMEDFEEAQVPKRKRLCRSRVKEAKAEWHRPKKQGCRWSAERYEIAEQGMLEILRAEGATFEKPITRPALRGAARKCIGDTGLLDHLLKHIEGKVAPGGTQRFRRWFNTNGVMEYWLEDADLAHLRLQAGIQDPYWTPSSLHHDQLKLLRAEFNKMKSEMQELRSSKQERCDCHRTREIYEEMANWKAETDDNLKLILGSWKSMQETYEELMAWKSRVEQQVVEIKSALEPKQHATISSPPASERWEDWLESAKLDDVAGNEVVPWFDTTDLVNTENDLYSYLPLPPKPAEPAPPEENRGEVGAGMNVTPDSCTTTNSVLEFHNSSSLCQEMFVEVFNWKAKVEEKLTEISKSVKLMGR